MHVLTERATVRSAALNPESDVPMSASTYCKRANQAINAATMSNTTVRILAAVRRSLAAPRACQARHRISASRSGITAV